MPQKPFDFTLQFAAGIGSVDSAKGILTGVTVAEVGPATGHYAFTDANGAILGVGGADDAPNFKGAVKRLQLGMDETSLQTVIAAGKKAKRFKTREDHDDSIEARAGYTENFRLQDGKVVCDQTIFESYRNRGVFLEAATQTPELIGLSGDFKFTAEVIGDKAMMRVTRIDAVDIVDQGALTHAGLFKAQAAQVDTTTEGNLSIMAKSAPEKPDFKAFKEMCSAVAAYRAATQEDGASIDECTALLAIAPVKVPTPPGAPAPVSPPPSNPDASVKDPAANFAELKTQLTTELTASFSAIVTEAVEKASKAQQIEFQKQMSALGLKPAPIKEPTAEEIEAAKKLAAAAAPRKTDFLSMKAARAKEKNIKPAEAAREIIAEHPEVFREYQVKLGIIRAA